MNCRRVQTHYNAYLDADLPTTQRIQLESHLDGCADCRDKLIEFELQRTGPKTPREPPPEFWAPMHEAVLKEYNKLHPESPPKKATWGVAYAIILIAVIGWTLYQPSPKDPAPPSSQSHSSTAVPSAFR